MRNINHFYSDADELHNRRNVLMNRFVLQYFSRTVFWRCSLRIPEHLLSWLRFFWFSSDPLGKCRYSISICQVLFLPNHSQIINHLIMVLSIYLSTYLPTYLSIYLYIHPSIYLSINHLSIYPSSIYPLIYLSIYLYIHLSIYPPIYLSIYLSIHPSIYLSIYLSIHLSIYPPIYLSTYFKKIYPPI
jgi:hypothetical protein